MLAQSLAITCLSNPTAGLEARWPALDDTLATTQQKILVVGGGPAGCEAAATAAALGHSVELWEQSIQLGGALNWTQQMPLRAEFQALLRSQAFRLEQHNVVIRFNQLATAKSIIEYAPDSVVVATGAIAESETFVDGGQGLTLEQALADVDALGQNVVVQDLTGSWAVASAIEYLADLGKAVTVVVAGGAPAWTINIYSLFALRQRWLDKRIRIIANHFIQAHSGSAAQLKDLSTGVYRESIAAASVIAARHGYPNALLLNELVTLQRGSQLSMAMTAVGDCQAPRTALEAIFEGHEVARNLDLRVSNGET